MNFEPRISRSVSLDFVGDWGQANFHKVLSWLTQEFCDRAGPRSRVTIASVLGGGIEALYEVSDGQADLCLVTPAKLMPSALTGGTIFANRAMPDLRALAVLPQNDSMMFAVNPTFNIRSFEDLNRQKPPLRIATSTDDGGNFIGYVARRFMEAHGIPEKILQSWGGCYVTSTRPDTCLASVRDGHADAALQEAIMTPWWRELVEGKLLAPVPAEARALEALAGELGLPAKAMPAGYWKGHDESVAALDFSDFLVVVRNDMPDDVAYLLTWCLTEGRDGIEKLYAHIPPDRSPLSYPLVPQKMANSPLPLHGGARRYYAQAGLIAMSE
jgi:uncharacterized protein